MNRTVQIATKTLNAIETALRADQGNAYRLWLGRVLPHIGDAYRSDEGGPRTHLGASLIGRECARELWYGFRWYSGEVKHDGRTLRLFNRGHLEEGRFIALLLMIGCEVYQQDAEGKQFRISDAGGHFGGSTDGVLRNVPDLAPDEYALTEFKTHGDKSFTQLKEQGVRASKFEHYVQMQVYMRKQALPVALYLAVNKNTDELYGEIVRLEPELADQFIDRGRVLVFLPTPPARINESPSFYKCRFCDHKQVCHSRKTAPAKSCRTCVNGIPREDGLWHCAARLDAVLDKAAQVAACGQWTPVG